MDNVTHAMPESPTELLLGELRYDGSPGLDFVETQGTIPARECPRWVPRWLPPRHELLLAD